MNQPIVRSNQDERDQPSRTVKIDMEMINTGVGAEQRRLRADLKRDIYIYFSVVTGTQYGTKTPPDQQPTGPCAGDMPRENYLHEFPSLVC